MDYDRDQAVLAMVDSNLHREKLLPSEKGFAYKMKLEALKNQHREMEFEMQMRSDEILAKEVGESRATIQRLIRITKLISPFRDLLDYECMTFGVAYVFAGCDPVGQDMLYCFFHENNVYPNLEQAKALQKLWESNTLTIENIRAIMIPEGTGEEVKAPKAEKEKAPKKESVKFGVDELSDYFPGMNAADMKAEMFSILAEWKAKQSVAGGESY
jgi:ParB family chromosome partitioning protein